MNEETTHPTGQEKPREHAASSSCSEKTNSLYPQILNTTPESAYELELALDVPVHMKHSENYSLEERQQNNGLETREYDQEKKQFKEEEHTQLHECSNTKTETPSPLSDVQTEQPNVAAEIFGDMSRTSAFVTCFNGINEEQEDKSIPPAIPQDGPVAVLPFASVSIVSPSHGDHRGQCEGLQWQDSSTKHDGVSQKVVDKDDTAGEIAVDQLLSHGSHISNEGKGHKQVFDMSAENSLARNQQLFNSIRETGVAKDVDAVVSNATFAPPQIVAELKEQEDNNQIAPSQTWLKTDRSQTTDTPKDFTGSNPHEHMDEIDLNDDIGGNELEKISSEPAEPQQLHTELHKYTELIGQSRAAVALLKRSIVKGVIARGNQMKDAVSEKLNIVSKSLETSTPNKCAVADDNPPPYPTTPSTINIATPCTPHSGATPCFFTSESINTYGQVFQHNLVPGAGNITDVRTFTSGPGFSDRSPQQLMPQAPIIHPQPVNVNTPFLSGPENSASFLRSTVTQSPGPMRGYTAFYPAPQGFHMPPTLPPPPPVSAMEYFANRYCSSRHPTPACVPAIANPPPAIDRAHFSKMGEQRPPITRQANYASSLFGLKSGRIKDNLQKLSTSLSETSRADPKADFFMEEGHIPRASIDSGSDRFRRHRFRVMTPDDLLMGALCCCCWPLGLAARLVTLTMPNNNGPVDSIIKAMSHQMTSIALVLGIASYFVFFLLWLSLFVVAVK
ncbi:hypothetical protein BsWGS_02953 [Bradybaena similaris]